MFYHILLHQIQSLSQTGIMCPHKVKDVQNISISRNTVAERVDDIRNNLRVQ
jgi:hypothetical protein